MKIATWNINGIRARQERVMQWAIDNDIDVLCMQELKCIDDQFPREEWERHGYQAATYGQKAYNGVALVSRRPLEDVSRAFGDGKDDEAARTIAATIDGIRVVSVYIPNGGDVYSESYQYKLGWLDRLHDYLGAQLHPERPALVCGDWNIAPADLDVYDPVLFAGHTHCTPEERTRFARIRDSLRMTDVLRHFHPDEQIFTWWDYRMLGFPKNKGMRIDHVLATPAILPRLTSAERDREARKGKNPSDHAPVIVGVTPLPSS